ncbi:hypothetical protein BDV3_002393 [Batrachochytrium dendrobatidis]|nr:oligosaccharyl transferase subunit ost3/OST6 [Batrachochytrium dendrobatidis]KAK5667574.1 oligosaccharyl transferase subunit ost3/OST6 [Batrachochytrium dendrobatidis]OAJ44403.1 hypothetical protein BDEG_27631 [Batrachochytrium dendrobatidis JEL423]
MHLFLATALWTALLSPLILSSVTGTLLDTKISQLNHMQHASQSILALDEQSYELLTQKPRNYTLFVVLTSTVPQHNCKPCVEWHTRYKIVADTWAKSFESGKLYFSELDFVHGQSVFSKLGIQSVPLVLRFPPTDGPQAIKGIYELYDLNRNGFSVEPFISHIEAVTGVKIKITKPLDYGKLAITIVIGATAAIVIFTFYTQIIAIITLKALWISLTLTTTLVMCGGYMWNTIRTPPFIGENDGNLHFLSGGMQYQFGVETHIVAIMYGIASAAFIALVVYVPKMENKSAQRTTVFLCLLAFMFIYSLILAVFKLKAGQYPFRLMF